MRTALPASPSPTRARAAPPRRVRRLAGQAPRDGQRDRAGRDARRVRHAASGEPRGQVRVEGTELVVERAGRTRRRRSPRCASGRRSLGVELDLDAAVAVRRPAGRRSRRAACGRRRVGRRARGLVRARRVAVLAEFADGSAGRGRADAAVGCGPSTSTPAVDVGTERGRAARTASRRVTGPTRAVRVRLAGAANPADPTGDAPTSPARGCPTTSCSRRADPHGAGARVPERGAAAAGSATERASVRLARDHPGRSTSTRVTTVVAGGRALCVTRTADRLGRARQPLPAPGRPARRRPDRERLRDLPVARLRVRPAHRAAPPGFRRRAPPATRSAARTATSCVVELPGRRAARRADGPGRRHALRLGARHGVRHGRPLQPRPGRRAAARGGGRPAAVHRHAPRGRRRVRRERVRQAHRPSGGVLLDRRPRRHQPAHRAVGRQGRPRADRWR